MDQDTGTRCELDVGHDGRAHQAGIAERQPNAPIVIWGTENRRRK